MVKIIINPHSSRALKFWKHIEQRMAYSRIEYDPVITWQRNVAHVAKKAQQDGVQKIFLVGGDGTINEAVNNLGLQNFVFGIIPAGSGNDFAKMLGIKTIDDGISSMLSGCRKSVDVGLVNDRYFVNNLGIGLNANIVHIAQKLRWTGSNIRYFASALVALLNLRLFNVEIESPDYSFSGPVLGITIANGRSQGGLFTLTPQAGIDDGRLDICVIKKLSVLKGLLNIRKALANTHIFLKEADTFTTDSLSICSDVPFPFHLDGELPDHPENKLNVRVLHKQLQFFLPANHP